MNSQRNLYRTGRQVQLRQIHFIGSPSISPMPRVFLIQASGNEAQDSSPATTKAGEPIEHGFYNHPNWHNQAKDDDFGDVSEGDVILLYCTANVDESPKQIKYIFSVDQKVEDRADGEEIGIPNKLILEREHVLAPGFPLETIRQWVDDGKLSEPMNRAGTQGFNIIEVAESDYEAIVDWDREHEPQTAIEHYEEELRGFIVEQGIGVVDPRYSGYTLFQDDEGNIGELYGTPIGEIDLLYQNADTGEYLAAELKRTQETSDQVVGQIARYIGWVGSELAKGAEVHGLIVTQTASQRLWFAVQALADCQLATYRLDFKFSTD